MTTLQELLKQWEARSKDALPTDAMLINKHIRELRAALAQQGEQQPVAWTHSCNALCIDGLELWIDHCPHCGKPRTAHAEQWPPGLITDIVLTVTALHKEVDIGWSPDARSHLLRLSTSIGMLAATQPAPQPTSGDYALGYAEGFNDACKPAVPQPEGYKLVPIEATREMQDAAEKYYRDTDQKPKGQWWWNRLYQAYIAAAPAPQPAQGEQQVCAGCGIPVGDVHMSTCKSGKWPSRVSNGDTAAPAPQAQEPA